MASGAEQDEKGKEKVFVTRFISRTIKLC